MIRTRRGITRRAVVRTGVVGLAGISARRPVGAGSGAPIQGKNETGVDAWLGRLALAEKVAQLFMVNAPGITMTPDFANHLTEQRPGGVILVGANIGTAAEIAAYVADIHATNPDLPPLVAVDQEGGPVSRLAGDPAPGAVELGLLPDAEVEALSRARAEYVAGFGFDVNFAPVADVAHAPDSFVADRAFGADPTLVAAKVAAAVAGGEGTGVLHAAKHFPGHGRAVLDSHLTLPEVDLSLADWRESDGLPFAAAVDAGVSMVMLGHLRYPRWDEAPTSISAVAVDVLRRQLGFDGVVVTDDLGMAALVDLDPFTVVDRALAAGVDLLLYVAPPVAPAELIAHVVRRVEEGTVPAARLDASLRRVLRLKLG